MRDELMKLVDAVSSLAEADEVRKALDAKYKPELTVAGFCWQDVQDCARDMCGLSLSREQSLEVLEVVERRQDAEIGVNWDVIACHASDYASDNKLKKIPKKVIEAAAGVKAAKPGKVSNTRVSYMYRDASNYKEHASVVVEGAISFADIKAALDCGENFIPSQVGLEDLQPRMGAFPSSEDHVWHEIGEDCFKPTADAPDAPVTAKELKAAFKRVRKDGWDLIKAEERAHKLGEELGRRK